MTLVYTLTVYTGPVGRRPRTGLNKRLGGVSQRSVRFEDFILQLDTGSRGYRARVLSSPFGEGVSGFTLPAMEGGSAAPAGAVRDLAAGGSYEAAGVASARPPAEIGGSLFRAVFQGQVRTLLDKSLGQLQMSPDRGLRLKIKLDPGDEELGALADLPWELLCDAESEEFFALARQTSLVRYLDVPRPSQPIPFTPPLRILAVGASPRGMQELDLEEEMRRLAGVGSSASGIEVQFLEHASAGAVRERLSGASFNILHFMGHGTFDRASGEGMLAFEGAGGALELVSGRAFATKLRDLRTLGVVVLNACNTARAGNQGGTNAFRGVANALVQGGVPAVVAMRRPIADSAAVGFATAFYRHLARGDSIDEALTEGRQAIHSARPETDEWATPVLFLRMPDGNVFVPRAVGGTESVEIVLPPAVAAAAAPLPAIPQVAVTAAMPAARPPQAAAPERPAPALRRRWVPPIAAGTAAITLAAGVYFKMAGSPTAPAHPVAPAGSASALSQAGTVVPAARPDGGAKPPPQAPPKPAPTSRPHAGGGTTTLGVSPPIEGSKADGASKPAPPKDQVPNGGQQAQPDSQAPVSPSPAAPADVSKLSAQVISLVRRDDGGLRLTVSFANGGDRSLAVALDLDGSTLGDDQGKRYMATDSDLLASGGSLQLAAGASVTHTFDFPAPKLGSRTFYFNPVAQGRRLHVGGSPITLQGSP